MKRISRFFIIAGLLAGIAACTSLPRMTPDMAVGRPVQLQGAKGPLSVAESKAVMEGLKSRTEQTNIFSRHLAVEEAIVGSPLTIGNKVTLLQDGPTTFKHMFQAIRAAKDHIYLETYIIEADDIGNRFAQELIAKRKQGVRVYLVYDSVGSLQTPPEFFRSLTDAGIEVLQFNPVNPLELKKGWDVNQRDHRKLLVVDGRTAYLGGINISSVYSSSPSGSPAKSGKDVPRKASDFPWRDTHIQIEGPVAGDFDKLFVATWENQGGKPMPASKTVTIAPKGPEVVRAIAGSPDEAYSHIYATLISAINSAESTVHLTVAYFVPDPQLVAVLKDAVARGVDVKLILPSKTDSGLVFYAARSYYTDLLKDGIKIYERRDALLHAKTAVIDGVWSTIGSTNLDWRSFLHNYELNAVVVGDDFGRQMETMFQRDEADSELITQEKWKRRPLLDRIKEAGSRLWAYWL